MSAASEILRTKQEQADRDGVMVKVSRQAVDETLAQYVALFGALESLFAMVRGECPSLLEDDHHFDLVTAALDAAR